MKFTTLRPCNHNGQHYTTGQLLEDHTDLATSWPDRFVAVEAQKPTEKASQPEGTITRRSGRRKAAVRGVATPQADPAASQLRIVPKGRDAYDILNVETGKTLNSSPLTKVEAERIVGAGNDGHDQQSGARDQ